MDDRRPADRGPRLTRRGRLVRTGALTVAVALTLGWLASRPDTETGTSLLPAGLVGDAGVQSTSLDVATPSPTAATTGPPAAGARPVRVPRAGSGQYRVAPAPGAPRRDDADVLYRVLVEREVPVDPAGAATQVDAALDDPRSWGAPGRLDLQRVASGPVDLDVVIATPATTDRLCRPLVTHGTLSCHRGERAVINAVRWLSGAAAFGGDLADYRRYVVNHEVGHFLGHPHEHCPAPGMLAPVMVQQTKSTEGCRPNPWPYPASSLP